EVRPRPVHFHTSADVLKRDFQPDGETAFFGNLAIFRIDERAAAERDHRFERRRQIFKAQTFEMPKVGFAVPFENLADRALFAALDFGIKINKVPAELFGEAPADGRLAGAHESDKVYPTMCHSRPLYRQSAI